MNDLSVIIAQNERAEKLANIKDIKEGGRVALVQEVAGLSGIGDVKTFDNVADAKSAAYGLQGNWYIA